MADRLDIFVRGYLNMPSTPPETHSEMLPWVDVSTNRILSVVAIILFLIFIKVILRLMPQLLYSIDRKRGAVSFEYNIGISRIRNLVALGAILPYCLIADRYRLYHPAFMDKIPQEWSVFVILCVFIGYFLLRLVCVAVFHPRSVEGDAAKAIERSPYSFFILLTVLELVSTGILLLCNVREDLARWILMGEIFFMFVSSVIRSAQILKQFRSPLSSILYLCGLEFVPAACLVASAVFF